MIWQHQKNNHWIFLSIYLKNALKQVSFSSGKLPLLLTLVFPSCHSAPLLSYRRSNWAQLSLTSAGGASSRSSTLYLMKEEETRQTVSGEGGGGQRSRCPNPGLRLRPTWSRSPGKAYGLGTPSAGCGLSPTCRSTLAGSAPASGRSGRASAGTKSERQKI